MHKNIKVGKVEFVAITRAIAGVLTRGWALPGDRFTDNPIVALKEAERLNTEAPDVSMVSAEFYREIQQERDVLQSQVTRLRDGLKKTLIMLEPGSSCTSENLVELAAIVRETEAGAWRIL